MSARNADPGSLVIAMLARIEKRTGERVRDVAFDFAIAPRVSFTVDGFVCTREHASPTLLAAWLAARVKWWERGVERFADAFPGAHREFAPVTVVAVKNPLRGIEASIEVFRAAFKALRIRENDIKVTWDTEANWARLRVVLASGDAIERASRMQSTPGQNVAALALWMRDKARGVREGSEDAQMWRGSR